MMGPMKMVAKLAMAIALTSCTPYMPSGLLTQTDAVQWSSPTKRMVLNLSVTIYELRIAAHSDDIFYDEKGLRPDWQKTAQSSITKAVSDRLAKKGIELIISETPTGADYMLNKIGRASCRERV